MSFEQCISVIHYKSTSLRWYITQKMGTSGKNESRNRFSIISFILESRAKYSSTQKGTALGHRPPPLLKHVTPTRQHQTETNSFPLPAVKTRISLLLCKGWGQYRELERQRAQSTHSHVHGHKGMGRKVQKFMQNENSCKKIPSRF